MAVYTMEEVNHHCKVEFSISSLFEMMACLRKCYISSGKMGGNLRFPIARFQQFFREHELLMKKFYSQYEYGAQLAEFLVDLPVPHTFSQLMAYIDQVSPYEFLYYLFGRYLSEKEIEICLTQTASPFDEIRSKITSLGGFVNAEQLEFAQNYEQYLQELTYLWEHFYQQCYAHIEPILSPLWNQANERLRAELNQSGIEKIVRKLLYDYPIPEQFPTKETKLIKLYPSYFVSPKFILIWGLGELHIVYDIRHYIKDDELSWNGNGMKLRYDEGQLQYVADIAKSLSEIVRVKILSFIANEENIKLQEMADQLNITVATVSRHLNLLKQSNLIKERKENGYHLYEINEKEVKNYCSILQKIFSIGNDKT
ncbi:transcriptional regulator [Geobacillus thermocatenulatus]|uniref:Transcriptional regulator n=1 Tax=Geobacillus thermocatenulatus TaxID=33938 RepID=A0A226QAD1_9BACL|nr:MULTISPECIES: ArsR family transcriptional regulator [Geobacillus]ASS98561.1 transcriptional regulator [Geobacillus thermocatenulatus]KLR74075.1 ArsR family transcriptional regulator [Geobacillus sp. T6]OXB89315.1 transcriptional regulator [Geobacillus thermocatenulatus]RAN22441.1 ArsR family transcriptional regulator [Geobacillus sp. A8]